METPHKAYVALSNMCIKSEQVFIKRGEKGWQHIINGRLIQCVRTQ